MRPSQSPETWPERQGLLPDKGIVWTEASRVWVVSGAHKIVNG